MADRVAQIDDLITKAIEAAGEEGAPSRERLAATQQLELLLRCQVTARQAGTSVLDTLHGLSKRLEILDNLSPEMVKKLGLTTDPNSESNNDDEN